METWASAAWVRRPRGLPDGTGTHPHPSRGKRSSADPRPRCDLGADKPYRQARDLAEPGCGQDVGTAEVVTESGFVVVQTGDPETVAPLVMVARTDDGADAWATAWGQRSGSRPRARGMPDLSRPPWVADPVTVERSPGADMMRDAEALGPFQGLPVTAESLGLGKVYGDASIDATYRMLTVEEHRAWMDQAMPTSITSASGRGRHPETGEDGYVWSVATPDEAFMVWVGPDLSALGQPLLRGEE